MNYAIQIAGALIAAAAEIMKLIRSGKVDAAQVDAAVAKLHAGIAAARAKSDAVMAAATPRSKK